VPERFPELAEGEGVAGRVLVAPGVGPDELRSDVLSAHGRVA
jgi:hypothetical protein